MKGEVSLILESNLRIEEKIKRLFSYGYDRFQVSAMLSKPLETIHHIMIKHNLKELK